jgi:hypothetical protein
MPEPDIDIGTLRRPRTQRIAAWFSAPIREITHLGWRTTSATVVACRPARVSRYYSPSMRVPYDPPILTGFIVEFSYDVNGRTYTGILDSPVEVQPDDKFDLRYNPAHPEENNSLGSTGDSGTRIATLTTFFLGLLILVALLMRLLLHVRRLLPFHP